ncbi:MAG: methyltransferase domain-containing protein [Kangiellaceae bacterium]|nr:methyltransferase domain-containing protein [Kangiellaceae bacterium]
MNKNINKPQTQHLSDLAWPKLPAGNRIRYIWQEWLQNHLEAYHGGCLLTFDSLTQCLSLPENVFEHCVKLGQGSRHDVIGDIEALPFMTDSLSSIILSHGFEYCDNPSIVLGEVYRSLAPQGKLYSLLYAPFNPWFLQGKLGLSTSKKQLPLHQLSLTRYKDWLNLLGFRTLEIEAIGCPWWKGYETFQKKSDMKKAWLSAPIAYMIKAEKKVSTMTPIKPLQEKLAEAMEPGLANVSTQVSNYQIKQ